MNCLPHQLNAHDPFKTKLQKFAENFVQYRNLFYRLKSGAVSGVLECA
jgi:hypothetical protein